MPRHHIADAYALKVTQGELPAGKYHRLACERHVRDRAREGTRGFTFRFESLLADRFYRFAETCHHYKGRRWAGQPIHLTECQRFRLGSLFGWVHARTGLRRFRTAYNELPRKQGKSLEAAIVAIYATFFDGEPGAEGYTSATKRDQAMIVFGDCTKLVQKNPSLKRRIAVHARNLSRQATDSKLEPLSADHDSMDGLNPHVVIVDEFQAHKSRGLIDVLETAMGAREQPIMFQITTAGDDEHSPCGDQHHYLCEVLDRIFSDETFFGFVAHADTDDDPFLESTWRKANPHYGVSVNPADMKALVVKAKHMPSARAEFEQKRLNVWVNASTPWLDLARWKLGQSPWHADVVAGRTCCVGLDLASRIDLAAISAVFEPLPDDDRWRVLLWFFTPADGLKEREKQYRVPLRQWVDQGFIHPTPGQRIDQDAIKSVLQQIAKGHEVRRVGVDPWNAGKLVGELQADVDFGEDHIVEIPQNMTQLSEPSKEFEAQVAEARVDAGGNPVMQWMVANAVVDRDGNDNIKPTKNPKKTRGRIDGVVATIMAMKLMRMGDLAPALVYNERGVKSLGQ